MAGSPFISLNKLGVMLKNTTAPLAKGFAASLDDAMSAMAIGGSASADDPAIKAKSFAGLMQDREIPAFKNVIRGAIKNRLIILPAAVAINAIFPEALPYVLAMGGAYLSYEAGETVLHGLEAKIKGDRHEDAGSNSEAEKPMTPDEYQKEVERSLLSTDPVMASEVTALSLSSIKSKTILGQMTSLTLSTIAISAAVFGAVLLVIRADNIAEHYKKKEGDGALARFQRATGEKIMKFLPGVLTGISYVGTGVMFGIGGELISRCVTPLEHVSEALTHPVSEALAAHPTMAGIASGSLSLAFATAAGLTIGVGLAGGHKVAAPYIDPPIQKAKDALAPVFNMVGSAKDTVVQTIASVLPSHSKDTEKPNTEKPKEPKQP